MPRRTTEGADLTRELIPCVDCGKEISELAAICPSCGGPQFDNDEQVAALKKISGQLEDIEALLLEIRDKGA